MEYISKCEQDTKNIAAELATELQGGAFVALFGGMGVGKTTFTRYLAARLGFEGEVSSPTFAIINEYIGGQLPIFHFDMYRVESFDDLQTTGFFEYIERGGIIICEWSENIENVLPQNAIRVKIAQGKSENERVFTVN